MRLCLIALLLSAPLSAQLFDFGVKGGFPMTDAFESAGALQPMSANWTVGPMAELNLPFGFGIEANLMYRKIGVSGARPYEAGSWSFPLLAKYKFPGNLARLYVSGGYSFRTVGDIPNLWDSTSAGFVVGAGIRYDLKLIRISPEFRWTRFGEGTKPPNPATDFFGTRQNQAEFLIGITF
jgi:hypothetical protein